jgi:hypothetical protein
MKKIILTMAMLLAGLTATAQNGIITVDNYKEEVPVQQWYIINEKELKHHAFFYAETSLVVGEIESMLFADGQSFSDPEGMDEDNDPYWEITRESGFITYIYFVRGKAGDEYSSIITVTR